MSKQKKLNKLDRKLLDSYHFKPCQACGSTFGVVAHHIKTKGSQGKAINHPSNLMPLCFEHHREVHDKGLFHMAYNYSDINEFLATHGWQYDDFSNKFIPPRFE